MVNPGGAGAVDTVTYSAESEFWAFRRGRILNPVLAVDKSKAASHRASAMHSMKRFFCKMATWPTTK